MNFDHPRFLTHLPPFFPSLMAELETYGFTATLVGGSVRDFLLTGNPGHDWDMELSHESLSFEKGSWKDLGKSLSQFGKMSFLPYEIIRVDAKDWQLEFSPPRIEHYHQDNKGHSNFDAEFNFKLPFSEAVKRRDFTINAMGVRFKNKKEIEFLDPLEGLLHLRDKVLHYAGPDFAKDPVRFLRAHRFANKLKFAFSPELRRVLENMHLDGITPAYLWSEMKKSSDPVNFISYLVQEKNQELQVPLDKTFTLRVPEIKKVLKDPRRFETWVIALEWIGINSDNWSRYFSMSTDTTRRLARWAHASREFQNIFPEAFHGEFEEVRERLQFDQLFDWYFTTRQLLQKNPELPLMEMIEEYLPHWIHFYRFEPLKDVKHIDPPFRAKYQVWNLCQRL
jgi:tRNA nucleotidyltransferase/poly(A) polymerase